MRSQPDASAVRDGTRPMTYGEMDRQANRIAQRLLREGLHPEDTVALKFDRS